MNSDYSTSQYFEERDRITRDQWVEQFREPEYISFQLVMHDVKSSLAWQVLEGRRTDSKRLHDTQIQHLRLVFSTFWYFASRNRGLSRSVYADLTARKLELSTHEVWTCIKDAVLFGVPGMLGVGEYELRRVA